MNVFCWIMDVDAGGLLGLGGDRLVGERLRTDALAAVSVAHTNEIGVPAGIPAPHWSDPVPAFAQVVCSVGDDVPAVGLQDRRRLRRVVWIGGLTALAGTYGVFGTVGTGP